MTDDLLYYYILVALLIGMNRVYHPFIITPAGAEGGEFVWSQTENAVTPPLGAWFLDDVVVVGSDSSFSESFESDQLKYVVLDIRAVCLFLMIVHVFSVSLTLPLSLSTFSFN